MDGIHAGFRWGRALSLILVSVGIGCANTDGATFGGGEDAGLDGEPGLASCTGPTGDWDKDGITDKLEGCERARDSDGDGQPDWQDLDSDDDGIFDTIERGPLAGDGTCAAPLAKSKAYPCDTDGDGYPDYIDIDSDDDKLTDDEEDLNKDGLLGCCLSECGKPAGSQSECVRTKAGDIFAEKPLGPEEVGCGRGQVCQAGRCHPPVAFACSDGETSPWMADTFGDGKLDHERGTFVCRKVREDKPDGRKAIATQKSEKGDWNIAHEQSATYGTLKLDSPGRLDEVGVINEESTDAEVAGFVLSRNAPWPRVEDALTEMLDRVTKALGSGAVTVRSSGSQGKSHDRYDTVKGTLLDIKAGSTSASELRSRLIAAVLDRPVSALGPQPKPFGASETEFIARLVTVKRFEFKRNTDNTLVLDAEGNPVDSGDPSKWRLVVMGAIASKARYQDPQLRTGLIVDDFSGGTALATARDTVSDECDVSTVSGFPVADILWVVDTSGSMSADRNNVAANAKNFYDRALNSGLDFRMGIVPACPAQKLCRDRFLGPQERDTFEACIRQPGSGSCETGLTTARDAVTAALPRDPNHPQRIRSDAQLVIIQVSDELPSTVKQKLSGITRVCQIDSSAQTTLDGIMGPHYEMFAAPGKPESAAVVHTLAGGCNSTCGAEVAHGYLHLTQRTGGISADICQPDLGATLQIMIDNIVGSASPVVLDTVPISASLAVALAGKRIERSRKHGFDYRASNNSLVFIGQKYESGDEVVASYQRWTRQQQIK